MLVANAMAAFMDFGVGCLIAELSFLSFNVTIPWQYIFIGGLLALIPDLDLVPSVLSGKSASFDHRQTLFHRPFVVLPLTVCVALLLGGVVWALVTLLCVLWHYLHDTNFVDTSYGIAWLWPFSNKYWSVWGSYISQSSMGHHQWLEHFWLRPTFLSARELSVGLLCLITAGILSAVPPLYLTIGIFSIVAGVGYTWFVSSRGA